MQALYLILWLIGVRNLGTTVTNCPFTCEVNKKEQFGRVFNPILATMLTSGSRLILAMVEAYVKENKGYFAYCDTDALFVNPELVGKIQALFRPLNPYTTPVEMFKVENGEDGKPLDNVWFYGVSAKRYCLYGMECDKVNILKHSSHGLGGLIGINEDEVKAIWKDILGHHYNTLSKAETECKYSNKYVMGKLALTSPFVLRRFRRTNTDKKLKPFNFVIVGIGHRLDPSTKEPIIPMVAYTKNTDIVPFSSFTDYKTGKAYVDNTQFYWKPFSEFLLDYMNHNDGKYDGNIGELKRKQIDIGEIEHIGKESNNLEESEVLGVSDDNYTIYGARIDEKLCKIIPNLTNIDAKQIGISRTELFYLKKKVSRTEEIRLKKKTLNKLRKLVSFWGI